MMPGHGTRENAALEGAVRRRIVQVFLQLFFLTALLFLCAGDLRWSWAWIYLASSLAVLAVNVFVLSPEVIAERGAKKANVKRWDRAIAWIALIPSLGIPTVSGLDHRFGWTTALPPAVNVVGLICVILGQFLFTWAMTANRFFSTLVRIQVDRDHRVATGGPYRYVRHPGYFGYIISNMGTPLALGSTWALVGSLFLAALIVVRTSLEDRTLRRELAGYAGYAERVRSRLIPGVW